MGRMPVGLPKSCSVKEFAVLLGIGITKAYEIANSKNSGFFKMGRTWRISEREMEKRYGVRLTDGPREEDVLTMTDAEFQKRVNRCIYNFFREIMADSNNAECKIQNAN